MRPTFTLTYGLRWEYQGSPYDQLNESFSLVNGFSGVFGASGPNNLFKPGTLTGSIPSFQLNNGRSWYNTDLHDFAPSVRSAWQPGTCWCEFCDLVGATRTGLLRRRRSGAPHRGLYTQQRSGQWFGFDVYST